MHSCNIGSVRSHTKSTFKESGRTCGRQGILKPRVSQHHRLEERVIIEQSNHKGTLQSRATCFELFRQSTRCWVAKPPAEARFQISNSPYALSTTPDCKH